MKTLIYQGKEIELNYSTTLNHLIPHQLWQCGLSLPALGLAGYLYTLPKQWRLSVTHLSKQLAMSKNTCRKYLKEIFSNEKAREVFKVKEAEINTYDFEEGLTAYDYASDKEELENFTSSVAKDVSEPNRKRVLLIQTQQQRYLLNLCFSIKDSAFGLESRISSPRLCDRHPSLISAHGSQSHDSSSKILESKGDKKVDSSPKNNAPKNAQNLSTINKNLLQDSYKDSSSKRTRKNFSEYLDLKRFSKDEQEAIKLWIRYKQESTRKPFKPSQIDFQLRKITRLKEQGQDICAVIEKSLDMGWQGLFPVIANNPTPPVIASAAKQSTFMDCHADKSARNDRITPKMPKNIGAKAILCVK